jgi:uncharacterized protein
MAKLLLLVLIGVVVYTLWKKSQSRRASSEPPPIAPPEAMLECSRCRVHFPAGEAVMREGRAYCCAAHAHSRSD